MKRKWKCPLCHEEGRFYGGVSNFFMIHSTRNASFNRMDNLKVCAKMLQTGKPRKHRHLFHFYLHPWEAFWMGDELVTAALRQPKFLSFWQAEMKKGRKKKD